MDRVSHCEKVFNKNHGFSIEKCIKLYFKGRGTFIKMYYVSCVFDMNRKEIATYITHNYYLIASYTTEFQIIYFVKTHGSESHSQVK